MCKSQAICMEDVSIVLCVSYKLEKKSWIINKWGHSANEWVRSPSVWGQYNLEELSEWEQVKEKRKTQRVGENYERYTIRKRAVSEKKKKSFSLHKLYL